MIRLPRLPKLQLTWLDVVGAGALTAAALFMFSSYPPDDLRRWWTLMDMAMIAPLLLWPGPWRRRERNEHLRFAALTLLMVGLIALQANITGLIIVSFVAAAATMLVLPPRQAYRWISVFGAITLLAAVLTWGYLLPAVLASLGCFTGYLFIGFAVDAQRRADAAQAESQLLIGALQAAQRQLQESARHAAARAVAEERNRLARELHDTLGHRLTVAAVQLEGAQRLIASDPDDAALTIGTAREAVREGLADLRRTVTALRAPTIEDRNLTGALAQLADQFQAVTAVAVHCTLPATVPDMPMDIRQTIYRTAQEGLANVQKHAYAHQVWLELVCSENQIWLRVADDGAGLPTPFAPSGFGLRGIVERAALSGGQLTVQNGPAGGAELALTLPLPASVHLTSPVA